MKSDEKEGMIELRFTTFKETETIPYQDKALYILYNIGTHGSADRDSGKIEIYLDEIKKDYENEAIFKERFENISDMILHIIYHELGHIVMNTHIERYCDNFADWLLCIHSNISKYRRW